jgi:NTE family protein
MADHLRWTHPKLAEMDMQVSGDAAQVAGIAALLEHCNRHFPYVIFHLGADAPVQLLMECMAHCGRTFLLIRPTPENLYHRDLLFREMRSRPVHDGANLKTIVCRDDGEERTNELLRQLGNTISGAVHNCPPSTAEVKQWNNPHFQADTRRLAREIARRRVGLALSAGGARGLSHIGVFQVLEEHGIQVDVVAGCSMGAYVGSVWACGYDGLVMERLAREVEHRWGLLELIDPFILPRQGFLRGEKVKRRLQRSIGDVHFCELMRPLRVVATNLATLDRAIFTQGEVAASVLASSAIPGACVPVTLGGEMYVDGGIADPLPVEVLEEMGVEKIIAVNTIPTSAYLRCRVEMEREQAAMEGKTKSRLKSLIHHYLNYFAPGNILDVILRSFNGAQMRVAELACMHADLVLRPLCFDGRWHDFRHPGKYIALGRREAEQHLDEIKALVNRKEPLHEYEYSRDTLATLT